MGEQPIDLLVKERVKKLEQIRKLGINPYPYSFEKTESSLRIIEKYGKLKAGEHARKKISIAGRIISLRGMGKAGFGHIQDNEGKIQFYVKEDILKEKYKVFNLLDIGDFIGIKGKVFRTQKGEITVLAEGIEVLCKGLRPLPEKFHGIKDMEIRYRQRYVDLIANPEVKQIFIKRAKIINLVREFLLGKGFVEVDIPLLQPIYGGANAKPFKTHINAWDMDMYLSISPELYLKRLIVGGFEKVFTITKCFRNEGVDKTHNPEFTMMECYSAYEDYNDMMGLVEDICIYVAKKMIGGTRIEYQGRNIELKKPWRRISMKDALKEYADIDVDALDDEKIKGLLEKNNIVLAGEYVRGIAIDALFKELVEAKLIQPVFIMDHPKETTPLCKEHRKDINLIERFEPFINGWEIGNAYSELNEPILQKELLKEQEEAGRAGNEEAHPYDEDFLRALEYGMPPTGGLGLGIDRIVMLFTNATSLREVILFPTMRKEEKD
ncbi:lysine--tRNA ligase [archaeon]|nr:lysine--tRNA ligase [archaeon]